MIISVLEISLRCHACRENFARRLQDLPANMLDGHCCSKTLQAEDGRQKGLLKFPISARKGGRGFCSLRFLRDRAERAFAASDFWEKTMKSRDPAKTKAWSGKSSARLESIEEVYDALAEHVLPIITTLNHPKTKYIIGLAGPPGAGKSTLAAEVVQRLNMISLPKEMPMDHIEQQDEIAAVLPMDGFHLYRSQLDEMEDPEEAHARRGAPWTFNPELLLKCLSSLRTQGSVFAPSFDHGIGDPVEKDVFIGLQHKIVIVEGNYLFLEEGIWKDVCSMFDEKWFIDIDLDTSMQRVLRRHMATGKEHDVAKWRVDYNDRPNAELIMKSKQRANLVIKSVNFRC